MIWLMAVVATYASAASIYLLVFAVASKFYKPKVSTSVVETGKILILLPVYKEDEVILQSARRALDLHYDKKRFDVAVIADSLQQKTMHALEMMGCLVVKMNLKPRSKAKAINHALSVVSSAYDICVVLDADNYLSSDALTKINQAYQSGAKAIQGQRIAKEISTPVSVLDATSEGINNTIFRKGHRPFNLSAALAGSGMAFDYFLFYETMQRIDATNGFDKDLEFEIISQGIKIEYLEDVLVYDEKVSSLDVLKKQRTRWFAAQIINIKKGFRFFKKHPSLDLLDKWWQMFLPSRLLMVGAFAAVTIISIAFGENQFSIAMALSTLAIISALVLAAPKKYWRSNALTVLMHLPVSFFTLVTSFVSIGKARKGFIHTPHTSVNKTQIKAL